MNQPEEWGYEAKFSVRTDFLDTTFRRSRQQQEGETYEQYCLDMHKEMFYLAVKLRQLHKDLEEQIMGDAYLQPPFQTEKSSPMPIIDYAAQDIKAAIKSAPDIETLSTLKEEASKHNLVSLYMERLRQLTNG